MGYIIYKNKEEGFLSKQWLGIKSQKEDKTFLLLLITSLVAASS